MIARMGLILCLWCICGCTHSRFDQNGFDSTIGFQNSRVTFVAADGTMLRLHGCRVGPPLRLFTYLTQYNLSRWLGDERANIWTDSLDSGWSNPGEVLVGEPRFDQDSERLYWIEKPWRLANWDSKSGLAMLEPLELETECEFCSLELKAPEILEEVVVPIWRMDPYSIDESALFFELGYVSSIINEQRFFVTVQTTMTGVGYPVFSRSDGRLLGLVSQESAIVTDSDAGFPKFSWSADGTVTVSPDSIYVIRESEVSRFGLDAFENEFR